MRYSLATSTQLRRHSPPGTSKRPRLRAQTASRLISSAKHPSLRLSWGVALALFVLALLPYLDALLTSGHYVAVGGDSFEFWGFEQAIRDNLAEGHFPLWNAYDRAGAPLMANSKYTVLYPIVYLFRWLPIRTYYIWTTIFHVWFAGIGVYLFCRSLGLGRWAALIAAAGYMLSGPFLIRPREGHFTLLWGQSWLGWLLLLYHQTLTRRRLWLAALTAICVALFIYSTNQQWVFFTAIAMAIFALYWFVQADWHALRQGLGLSAMVGFLSAGLVAVHFLPSYEWLQFTNRSERSIFNAAGHELNPVQLAQFYMPLIWQDLDNDISIAWSGLLTDNFLWVGALTATLTLLALILRPSLHRRLLWFILPLLSVTLFILFGAQNPLYRLLFTPIAVLLSQPMRMSYIFLFGVVLLAAIGVDSVHHATDAQISKVRRFAQPLSLIALSGVIVATVIAFAAGGRIVAAIQSAGFFNYVEADALLFAKRNDLLLLVVSASAIAISLSTLANTQQWQQWTAALVMVELLFFAMFFTRTYPIPYQPELAPIFDPLDPAQHRIADMDRRPPIYSLSSTDMFQSAELRTQEQVSNLGLGPDGLGEALMAGGYLPSASRLDDPDLKLVNEEAGLYLYRYEGMLPRIYAVSQVVILESDQAAIDFVSSPDFDPLAIATIHDAPDIPPTLQATGDLIVSAEYTHYTHNRLTAEVEMTADGFVVFSENYFPGWQATVNDEPTTIYQANIAYRGLFLPEGQHTIQMVFRPRSFVLGGTISLITLGITLAIGVIDLTRKK